MDVLEINRHQIEPTLIVMHAGCDSVTAVLENPVLPPGQKGTSRAGFGDTDKATVVGAGEQDVQFAGFASCSGERCQEMRRQDDAVLLHDGKKRVELAENQDVSVEENDGRK